MLPWTLALCLALCSTARADTVSPTDQVTIEQNAAVSPEAPLDIPLDQPPLARTVTGFQPEGISTSPWQLTEGGWTMLVSWQTGEPKVGPTKVPPSPYNPDAVHSVVRFGLAEGKLNNSVEGDTRLVYKYKYGKGYGDMTYQSPILHHVLLKNLTPGSIYYYSVGSPTDGFSEEIPLRVPGGVHALPIRIGVVGDPGQTNVTVDVLRRLATYGPDVLLMLGDMAYADMYYSNGTRTYESYNSDQRRWDAWARMMQPLAATVPMLTINGNHELEQQLDRGNLTFMAYNSRYPSPQSPASIAPNTLPNHANAYLNTTYNAQQFINSGSVVPNNSYYSVDLPGTHLVALSTYLPYGEGSKQLQWFEADLAKVDRARTPWLLIIIHVSPRQTYVGTYKQVDDFQSVYEPLFYKHRVDAVLGGHTHSYERSFPMYNFTVDSCGPMYLCVGDGGTMDGMSNTFIDQDPQPYCANSSLFTMPWYQATPSGKPLLTLQEGPFCPEEQPEYSAHRDVSYGSGILTIYNATHAEWAWYRNQDEDGVSADTILIQKDPACEVVAGISGLSS